jgi:hypothetical protein
MEVMTSKTAEFLLLTYEDNEGFKCWNIRDNRKSKEKVFYNIDLPKDSIFDKENIKSEYWANLRGLYLWER